ncbi:MAG: putative selenium-dependent hydroxylase accessory protein YqeC [Chloroflexi bacterium]|nr:putative selenium-dependent hydroxylase accessory protein YqeC [Chloroflexota bacterium]
MKLHRALELTRGAVVAFVGAGGKTSALVRLGYELADMGWRVLATTTTRIGQDQLPFFPQHLPYDINTDKLSALLNEQRFVFLRAEVRAGKVYGPPLDWFPRLLDSSDSDVLLIEADGARGLPLKAPYGHEPVIPAETSLVVPVASMAVLGQPLDEKHVYNASAIIEHFGFVEGSRVKSPWVAQVLRDEALGLRGVPPKARVTALLNSTPASGYVRGRARLTARLILRQPRVHSVALGSVRASDPVYEVQRNVGAVVLAAGMSKRMGQMKVLMPWADGKPIIEHILEQLLLAHVDHICVVTGNRALDVAACAGKIGAETVFNPDYASSEMLSSLKIGLRAMPAHIAAALVVLGDQPRLQPKIVTQVVTAYAEGLGEIIAPSYLMRRGHPILIDRRYWQEILALPEDGAPRDVINAHADRVAYVNVDNDSVLTDVDTPQDYQRERGKAGLKD